MKPIIHDVVEYQFKRRVRDLYDADKITKEQNDRLREMLDANDPDTRLVVNELLKRFEMTYEHPDYTGPLKDI